jgi:hypothetical protein
LNGERILKIEKATELDRSDGKRALVYKDGVQIGAIRIIRDESAWQFRITAAKNMTQGESLADLTGEELKKLYEVVSTQKV